jgi:hypothetical protein
MNRGVLKLDNGAEGVLPHFLSEISTILRLRVFGQVIRVSAKEITDFVKSDACKPHVSGRFNRT